MLPAGIFLALVSAAVWGSGDFAGGIAARRSHHVQVLALSAVAGLLLLGIMALLSETLPSASDLRWAALAGLASAIGIASLYRGLAIGDTAVVASVAAVVTAVMPVIFAAFTIGPPGSTQLLGFALAVGGIWLVTRAPGKGEASTTGLKLALLAGTGFGGFLILIGQIESDLVFAPLAMARSVTAATAIVLMVIFRIPLPSPSSNGVALLAGTLDAGGNVFYVLARQHTRLDVAAVLSSLYPIATVVLARLISNERVRPMQWVGAGVCLAAVALIAI